MRTGICVQIGLEYSAEYFFLTERDWRDKCYKEGEEHWLPDSFLRDFDNWIYYGIDEHPDSVAYVRDRYGTTTPFLNARVNGRYGSGEAVAIGDNYIPTYLRPWGRDAPFYVEQYTLSALFDKLELKHLDLLVLDIEGAELDALVHHDWKVVPRLINVEIHNISALDNDTIKAVLNSRGYKCLREMRVWPESRFEIYHTLFYRDVDTI